ncbi:hypothetical protein M601_014330 [Cellulophaga baltica 4]|uniref:hypothetical protein n=2 Tax=Cellulophaga baltica TaxID=76594 RepID=UPI0012DF6A5E|nr:hypothetical protein [Cellulophaga baltica]WFO15050.1 hypothetical protein M601_014330 [Cellulophaga baltica 4]
MKLFLWCCITMFFVSCATNNHQFIGKWTIVSIESNRGNEFMNGLPTYVELTANNRYILVLSGDEYSGEYIIDSKNSSIDFIAAPMHIKGTYSLNDTKLHIKAKKYVAEREDEVFGTLYMQLEKYTNLK